MQKQILVIGAGLAGSEAAYQLGRRGFDVTLVEMRPEKQTPVHKTAYFAELVCSNSLKSMKPESAAGMLKEELTALGSMVFECALNHRVQAGGALAVDRDAFAMEVTRRIESIPSIHLERREAASLVHEAPGYDAVVVATGPLTSDALAEDIADIIGSGFLAFYDAAAPIVDADTLDLKKLFVQSRYEEEAQGDYLNAPFTKEEYDRFKAELVEAKRVIAKDFEMAELFSACQPIEEIARKGHDAMRFGPLKPVGLTDPATGKRPWAVLQLRAENAAGTCYNLVGCQTNLTFGEQERVFRLVPGLEHADFVRFGVMHRNTFIDAPQLLDDHNRLRVAACHGSRDIKDLPPLYLVGQLAGTEGYCEAIRSGLHGAIAVTADLRGIELPIVPAETAFGALLAYATNPETVNYQPMHVNFGIMAPLANPVRNKRARYEAYAQRGSEALRRYVACLRGAGLMEDLDAAE